MQNFDVAVVGAGPAGSTCATLAARAGLSVLLIDRAIFPRPKVCGDCINPSAWEIFDRLGVAGRVRMLPHTELDTVRFESTSGDGFDVPLSGGERGEIAVRRSDLDALLLEVATNSGATVRQGERLKEVVRTGNIWMMDTESPSFHGDGSGVLKRSYVARYLVAADGRNSTVTRLLGIAPPIPIGRIAVQSHAPLAGGIGPRSVLMRLLPEGYAGVAPIGDGEMNICLVCAPRDLQSVRAWAERSFELPAGETPWHSIAPVSRKPVSPVFDRLFVLGDAARVVEPFTGEGTYYAMRSGALAAEALPQLIHPRADRPDPVLQFRASLRAMYRNRLWVNRLAKLAVTHPMLGDALLAVGRAAPGMLPALTARVVRG